MIVSFTDYVAVLMYLKYCCHKYHYYADNFITIINISKYEKNNNGIDSNYCYPTSALRIIPVYQKIDWIFLYTMK